MTFNIALEAFGIAVSLPLLYGCCTEPDRREKATILFRNMLVLNIIVLLSDALTWALDGRAQLTALLYLLNSLVYSLGYVITALFTNYLVLVIGERTSVNMTIPRWVNRFCAIAVILVVVSLFTHIYFSIEDGVYVRGPLYWVSQAFPICIILLDMYMVLRDREALGTRDALVLMSYGILPIIAMIAQMLFFGVTLLYLSTTLSLLVIHTMIHTEKAYRLKVRESELTQMRISIMLSQIQPHFLYNSLSTIRQLCKGNPEAEEATLQFAEFLRGNMDSLTADKPIPFSKELAHTKSYLSLEKLRFEERLNVVLDLQTTEFRLPTLTLQPIVENAVRYGVTKKEDGGTVSIKTEERPDAFVITVSDDGVGYDPMLPKDDGRTHIGISNVRSRLKRMCGGSLEITGIANVGTTAVITIPKEREK